MTLAAQNTWTVEDANGVKTSFAIGFKVYDTSAIEVLVLDPATGVETLQAAGTDYAVTGTASAYAVDFSGLGGAPANGLKVAIRPTLAASQGAAFDDFSKFPASRAEGALDRAYHLIQALAAVMDRCVRVPADEDGVTLPARSAWNGKVAVPQADGSWLLIATTDLEELASRVAAIDALSTVDRLAAIDAIKDDFDGADTIGDAAALIAGIIASGLPGAPFVKADGSVVKVTYGAGLSINGDGLLGLNDTAGGLEALGGGAAGISAFKAADAAALRAAAGVTAGGVDTTTDETISGDRTHTGLLDAGGKWDLAGFGENLVRHGGVGDDITINDLAVAAAKAAAGSAGVFVPEGVFDTDLALSALPRRMFGPGQVRDAGGNKRAPRFTQITAPPSSFGNWDSPDTAFNGDLTTVDVREHRISGATTLGTPASPNYFLSREVAAEILYSFVAADAGANAELDANKGRTGAATSQKQMFHQGNGDAFCNWCTGIATGTRAGFTHFLAAPAIIAYAGQLFAGADGIYMQGLGDLNFNDLGYDAAAQGLTFNFIRTNKTGAKSTDWTGLRVQTQGSQGMNAWAAFVGKADIGFDLCKSDFGANQAAVTLAANQRIYGAATNADEESLSRFTVPGTSWLEYSSGVIGWNFVVGNTSVLQVSNAVRSLKNIELLRADGNSAILDVKSSSAGGGHFVIDRRTIYAPNDFQAGFLEYNRGRGTEGTPSAIQTGDGIAQISARGYQNGAFRNAGNIRFEADGVSGDFVGGKMIVRLGDGSSYAGDAGSADVLTVTKDKKATFAGVVDAASLQVGATTVIDQDRVPRLRAYTVATVPAASAKGAGAQIFVPDELGGATPAYSDGTDWRRLADRAVISAA